MFKILSPLIIIFLALAMPVSLSGQVIKVYSGEPAMLIAQGYSHGHIQWQQSSDQNTWTDIPGVTGDSALVDADSVVTWYRGKITSGTCATLYTDTHAIKLFECGDTIMDYRDGRKYPTVQIGSQCWMGKNLAVGQMIPGDQDMEDNGVIERYCYDDDTLNCQQYGALYQWDEMMQYDTTEGVQGICPTGWYIPSDQDYIQLELELGMSISLANLVNTWRGHNQGTQLSPSGNTGFNANYTGIRFSSGVFYNMGTFEYLYTSTQNSSNPVAAWRRCLDVNQFSIGRYNNTHKNTGGSVRCIKKENAKDAKSVR